MRTALDVHRALLAADVPHDVVRVRASGVSAADDLPRALDLPPSCCVAVRCYVTDVGTGAVVVRAGVVPHPRAVLDALGAGTLRAATAGEVNAATDFTAGLVSPVGLPVGVLLLVDAALTAQQVLYCPAGEGGVVIALRTADLLATTGARVAALSVLPLAREQLGPWGDGARVVEPEAVVELVGQPRTPGHQGRRPSGMSPPPGRGRAGRTGLAP